jgi:uncharacterized RDD family membrane protein YckC
LQLFSSLHFAAMDDNQVNELIHITSPDAPPRTLEVAGVGARSYAFVLDWHIRLLVALLWIYSSALLFYDLSVFATVFAGNPANTSALVIFLPAMAIYFLYHPVLEILMHGSTPGKRMAGVCLITHTGSTPGFGRNLIRNIFRLIDGIPGVYTVGLLVAIFTRHHVRIGDIVAGTLLVYTQDSAQRPLANKVQTSSNSMLSLDDQALLIELLERWQQLDKKQRVHLGRQFLARAGDDFPSDDPAQLKAHLEMLAANST